MESYWWHPHMFAWIWILPFGFLTLCAVFMFVYLFRGPHWFLGRRDLRELGEAAREILDRRYAGGEITKEQYEETKRVLGVE